MKEIRYYTSYSDDFEQTANQEYRLPKDYQWVRSDPLSKLLSGIIYALAVVFGGAYCKFVLRMRIKGRKNLKGLAGDYFIYANHTQPIGDVFLPALCVLPKRIYTVVSPANYGIPFIGKLLPYLGALPIGESLREMKELHRAIAQRLHRKHPICIFPEAHVWAYCTEIRPFPETSFHFPIQFEKPAVVMTATYKKSRFFKRPVMELYLDGPFHGEGATAKERIRDLHEKVHRQMVARSKQSNDSYIVYKPKP